MKPGDVWGSAKGKLCGAQKVTRFAFTGGERGVHFVTRSCSGKWSSAERFRPCASAEEWNRIQTKAKRTLLFNEKA